MAFVIESEVYEILSHQGIHTPKHLRVLSHGEVPEEIFPAGMYSAGIYGAGIFSSELEVVVKGLASDLWHKSDVGGVEFCRFSDVQQALDRVRLAVGEKWVESIVCEKIPYAKPIGLPSEALVSLRKDAACGWIFYFGIGGIHAEEWAGQVKPLVLPLEVITPSQVMDQVCEHLLGKIWLGKLRQGQALLEMEVLRLWIENICKLPFWLDQRGIDYLEVNPFVVSTKGPLKGQLIALDGVATTAAVLPLDSPSLASPTSAASTPTSPALASPTLASLTTLPAWQTSLLNPKRIGIVGASSREDSVGFAILENILRPHTEVSGAASGAAISTSLNFAEVIIVKPGATEFMGRPCVDSISCLKENPVDILIIALPSDKTVEVIKEVVNQGGGAHILYLVAGGLGDGGDHSGRGNALLEFIENVKHNGGWVPRMIGPNGLGMILAPLNINTLFIPESKLKIEFDPSSQLAMISQSGAFLITRISRLGVKFKYAFSIGNQMDLSLSEMLSAILSDSTIQVVAIYAEGFKPRDALSCAQLMQKHKKIKFIFYKGGRTEQGQSAASGHTGAIATQHEVVKQLLLAAGALVTQSFFEFNSALKWVQKYPQVDFAAPAALVSNAGFEAVGFGDFLTRKMANLGEEQKNSLKASLKQSNLENLVSVQMPLDLTPMADDHAWTGVLEAIGGLKAGRLILGLVPMTKKLETKNPEIIHKMLNRIRQAHPGIALGSVVDSGSTYQEYKAILNSNGIAVFDSIDEALVFG